MEWEGQTLWRLQAPMLEVEAMVFRDLDMVDLPLWLPLQPVPGVVDCKLLLISYQKIFFHHNITINFKIMSKLTNMNFIYIFIAGCMESNGVIIISCIFVGLSALQCSRISDSGNNFWVASS